MGKELKPLMNQLWKIISDGIDTLKSQDSYIIENNDIKEKFEKSFQNLYVQILQNYMDVKTETLDRHKVAAILLISIIETDILRSEHNSKKIFMGNYILASDTALTYMLSELNSRLKSKQQNIINSYYFPEALACETNYYRIFYRNLYYIDKSNTWTMNPLDLAERLFLLEYITLKENKIDISILKEY